MKDEILAWYEKKREEARLLAAELERARAAGAPADEIRRLERKLENAREVGD